MADFCWGCLAAEIYPEHPERNDFAGLVGEDYVVAVLCEGCGPITVNFEGKRVADCSVCGEPTMTPADVATDAVVHEGCAR